MYRPKFIITNKINNELLEIERTRGFLDAAQLKGDWIKEMQSAALILEAHHSTHIEGTQLTLSEAQKILAGKPVKGVRPDDRQELLNYKDAMNFVSEYLDRKSEITEEMIRDIHRILVKDVRGGSLEPGRYRRIQNYVVNSLTGEIIYTPPPSEDVPALMNEFVDWLNEEKDISPILMAGVAQHRFVDIHPFLDGNGRTARVLCTLILYQNGYDFKRLFSLSEFYDKNRRQYYDSIQSVREMGMDTTVWLEYFVRGLKNQMLEVKNKGEVAIRKEVVIERAEMLNLNDRQRKILMYLLEEKRASVDEIGRMFDFVRRTIQRDLAKMVELGLIKEVAKSKTDPTKYYELL
ncbi:MAG TPA: Fic family protein [Candidatus Methanoperedens sp.]|nr:Fic family protein [Candidatus Methanoperedens sp.]HLB69410.1 Fic family protein [Candidatus Methanoperedens sp.]